MAMGTQRRRKKAGEGPAHQLAMVFDLNKCLGCQTCSIACKTQWTREEGMESMWWTVVNTMPGRGTPRDWEHSGGGFTFDGKDRVPRPGRLPTREDFAEGTLDRRRTDRRIHVRSVRWYRGRLRRHFVGAGGGVFLPRRARSTLLALERQE